MSARRRRVGSESESPSSSSSSSIATASSYPYSSSGLLQSERNQVQTTFTSSSASFTAAAASGHNPVTGSGIEDREMTCRDRTSEFQAAVKSMTGRQVNGIIPGQIQRRGKPELIQYNEFMRIAKHIGKDIGGTYAKLEKLTILAKRKSLFEDRPIEIEELTYIIKQDIGSLNKQIAQLQTLVKERGSRGGHHIQKHSNSVVVSLQSKLASMSNDFKKVLEVRTENLKHQKSRRDQFTQGAVNSTLPPSAMSGYPLGSVLLADEKASGTDFAINMDGTGPPLSQANAYQRQMQIVDEQDSYLQERADTMQNIESTIVELGGIFQQLAFMVKEQEEMIQRIDHNVEDTEMNVEAAHTELVKYFRSVTSNRWLMIKVFAILIFFFIVFVIFMA